MWVLAVLATVWSGCAAAGPVFLDGGGGETWRFARQVTGSIVPGACDAVVLVSPRGVIAAHLDGERFAADVPLAEGANDIRAQCHRDGTPQDVTPAQRWLARAPDRPHAEIRLVGTAAGTWQLDAGASAPASGDPVPLISYRWHEDAANPASLLDALAPVDGRRIALVPHRDGDYRLSLQVVDGFGREDTASIRIAVTDGRVVVADDAAAPPWMARAVVYGIAPGLVGGFDGVRARLDALVALGIDTLWVGPVTEAPDGDFGYALADTVTVRASLGGEDGLRALIAAAHARGLRVILDVVVNHLSDQHPYARDVAARGRASPYWGLFEHGPDGGFVHYFDWRNLLNLDYRNPEVGALMLAAFRRWVRELGVDGFRVDAAWGVRERAPAFWPAWRAELKRLNPDLLLLAEASARDPYYRAHGFDAAYDWTESLGQWAWDAAFQDGARTAPRLRAAIGAADPTVFRFLANNDTGARFLTRYGLARTRLAAAMLLTLPGIPSLYVGDETGAAFEPYGPAPRIDDTDPHGLRAWYAEWLALRRTHGALRSAALDWVETSAPDTVLAYRRADAIDDILVVLNFSDMAQTVALGQSGPRRDLQTGERLDATAVPMPAFGIRLLKGPTHPVQ